MILPRLLDDWLRASLKKRGYVFMRQTNPYHYLGRRMQLMRSYGIDLVLDVGANSGQYARRLRSLGYSGQIVSFEPMRGPFLDLQAAAAKDDNWSCLQCGLGDADAEATIHVSENSVSSSLLPMLPSHDQHAPRSKFVDEERIQIERLDMLSAQQGWTQHRNTWLKIDVQGYEHKVLAGAAAMLPKVAALQLELSLVPLYSGQLTMIPMLELLADLGFDPVAFEPGFEDKATGEYLQVDGIFRNRLMKSAGH
jgi:FkbM family methyltransferase